MMETKFFSLLEKPPLKIKWKSQKGEVFETVLQPSFNFRFEGEDLHFQIACWVWAWGLDDENPTTKEIKDFFTEEGFTEKEIKEAIKEAKKSYIQKTPLFNGNKLAGSGWKYKEEEGKK
jgi:hypothetical protein